MTWEAAKDSIYDSREFKQRNCESGYYHLGEPLEAGALTLNDLFAGRAKVAPVDKSQKVVLHIPTAKSTWDQKMPIVRNHLTHLEPNTVNNTFLAFTRASIEDGKFTMVVLRSGDALEFHEIGPLYVDLPHTGMGCTFYDGHIAVDHSFCPPRYYMTMECLGNGHAASLCTSFSTTPSFPYTWSAPMIAVDGCNVGPSGCKVAGAMSASTGYMLIDGGQKYIGWAQVYDGVKKDDPHVRCFSQSMGPVNSYFEYLGTVQGDRHTVYTQLNAEPNVNCTSSWDCNNRNTCDWVREGDFYYVLYQGSDKWRPTHGVGSTFARSRSAVGAEYTDRLHLSRGIDGAAYATLAVINGQIFVYFAGHGNHRSPLIST